jgi:hypothetical protein
MDCLTQSEPLLSSLQAQSTSIALTPIDIDMIPPPEATYESLDTLEKAINDFARPQGYGLVKARSKRMPGSNRLKIYFNCDRYYKPNRSLLREQESRSRGTGCSFSVLASETACKTAWELKHRDYSQFGRHNHAPSTHPAAHPVHRRMPLETRVISQALHDSGLLYIRSKYLEQRPEV